MNRHVLILFVILTVSVILAGVLWWPALALLPGEKEFHVSAFPGRIMTVDQSVEVGPQYDSSRIAFQVNDLTVKRIFYIDFDRDGKVINCRACQVEGNTVRPGWYQAVFDENKKVFIIGRVSK